MQRQFQFTYMYYVEYTFLKIYKYNFLQIKHR